VEGGRRGIPSYALLVVSKPARSLVNRKISIDLYQTMKKIYFWGDIRYYPQCRTDLAFTVRIKIESFKLLELF